LDISRGSAARCALSPGGVKELMTPPAALAAGCAVSLRLTEIVAVATLRVAAV